MSDLEAGTRARTPDLPEGAVLGCPESGHAGTDLVPILGVRAPMPVSGTREERVGAIAGRQRARVNRLQLRAARISDSAIGRMVARGFLRREHRSVYAVGPDVAVPWARETSALLALAEGCLLSHHTAALAWGLVPEYDGDVEVTVPRGQTGSPRGVTVHRTSTLLPRDTRIHHGLPVTSPARTLLDLAASLRLRALERALDEALVTRIVTLAQLQDVAARAIGHRGAGALAGMLAGERPTTRTRSEAEERFLALVREAGLPAPDVNARAHGFEIDFLWREHGVVLEIDSWSYHRTRSAFERDRRKGAVLSAAGLSVVRATPAQVGDEPLAVIVRVAQTLAHAA